MAAKKVLFWLGLGVINIDGKDYGAEMPLPVDKLDPKDLKKMKKDGRVGEKIVAVSAGCNGCKGHLETIEAKNVIIGKLKETAEELAEQKAAHVKAHADNPVVSDAELVKKLAEATKLNVELDTEVKRLTGELDGEKKDDKK